MTRYGSPPQASADAFSDNELRAALDVATLPVLLPALAHLTGDDRWISAEYAPTMPVGLDDHDDGGLPTEVQARIREEAFEALRSWRDGTLTVVDTPSPARIAQMLSFSVAEEVPAAYGRLIGEELGVLPRVSRPKTPDSGFHVVIVGAGLSGLCLALRLKEAGIAFTVIEKNEDVGGSWHENTYPGCGVDTPSHLYSLSFAQNPDWTRYFTGRDELARYWRDLADQGGVRESIRFSTHVESASYDESSDTWDVYTRTAAGETGRITANVLVSAVGLLNRPSIPNIPGLTDFNGPAVHTAQWDTSIDLSGARVGVIGTGASAMQFVPAAAKVADHVVVFQRTPQWAMPHPNRSLEVPELQRFLFRHVPHYLGWYRVRVFWRMGDRVHGLLQVDKSFPHQDRAVNRGNDRLRAVLTGYIESQLEGRADLIAKSIPDYPPYGKRLLIDHGWYETIRRENVDLVTGSVEQITETGVRTADGVEHPVDVLVFATGFEASRVISSMNVVGRNGKSLRDVWGDEDGRAHLGITVPGFPNFFCLYGPNTNTGHGGTVVAGTEMQVQYVTAMFARMIDDRIASVEVRQEAFEAYDAELAEALSGSIWMHPRAQSYYVNGAGRVVTNSPWKYVDYWSRVHEPNMEDFHMNVELSTVGAATESVR